MSNKRKPKRRVEPVPPPGPDGSYVGSCCVCMRGTDTGFAINGVAEAVIGLLLAAGIPNDQATEMILQQATESFGSPPGTVPQDKRVWGLRMCEQCALPFARNGIRVGLVANGLTVYNAPDMT